MLTSLIIVGSGRKAVGQFLGIAVYQMFLAVIRGMKDRIPLGDTSIQFGILTV